MIKAIIFDADGVVIDSQPVYARGDRIFLDNHGVSATQKEFEHLITGTSLETGVKIFQDQFGLKGDPRALLNDRISTFKTVYKDIPFVPGFLEFYKNIRNNYKTAIATSSNIDLFAIADSHLGLSKLFEGNIYYLKDVGNVSKPAPDIFLYAAKQLGVPPENCLVIEDAVNGIKAAKNAGMKCVGLATTHPRAILGEADVVVNKFEEINLSDF